MNERTPVRILLAEDEKINQLAMQMLLQEDGYEVITADNGRQVLDLLSQRTVDCVLMDIQMPQTNGFDATRAIRSGSVSEEVRSIPIFALTAHVANEDREACLDAGMTDVLTKPVLQTDVRRMLERYGISSGDSDSRE